MKIVHKTLQSLLTEVQERGKGDGVRVAALMQSTIAGAGVPRITSWVIVSGRSEWDVWAEWRHLAGCQRAELTENGFRVPDKLAGRTEAKLATVRGRIEEAGLAMRDGILAADGELFEGVLD